MFMMLLESLHVKIIFGQCVVENIRYWRACRSQMEGLQMVQCAYHKALRKWYVLICFTISVIFIRIMFSGLWISLAFLNTGSSSLTNQRFPPVGLIYHVFSRTCTDRDCRHHHMCAACATATM